MTREEIIKEIEETEKKLRELKDKLDNTPTTSLKEQFQNVLIKGNSCGRLIKVTPDGFIDEYIQNRLENDKRNTTVYIEELVDDILFKCLVDNYKNYLEIVDILVVDEDGILNENEYNKRLKSNFFVQKPKQYFLDFINDVIEADVSEFEIDW